MEASQIKNLKLESQSRCRQSLFNKLTSSSLYARVAQKDFEFRRIRLNLVCQISIQWVQELNSRQVIAAM